MFATINDPNYTDRALITTNELKEKCGAGRSTAVKIGTAAGAKVKIGSRTLWNLKKVLNYLDSISEGK